MASSGARRALPENLPASELAGYDAVLAQARHENFPVASVALGRRHRAHLLAIYGFARLVDDTGDEYEGDRLEALSGLEAELRLAVTGRSTHPVFVPLSRTITALDLPLEPFAALIEANRQDQVVSRYATYDDLVDYCMLSAAPVGRLVLSVFGVSTPDRQTLSDDVCVGLQLVEHLQDVGEDFRSGRIYLPQADLERLGCSESELGAAAASPGLRRVVAEMSGRARRLLASGTALAATVHGRIRVAIAGYAGGGLAVLDAVERHEFDVLACPSRPATVDVLRRSFTTLAGRPHSSSFGAGLPRTGVAGQPGGSSFGAVLNGRPASGSRS